MQLAERNFLETVNEQQNEEGIAWAAREGIFVKSSAVFDQIVQNFDSLFMMYVEVEPSICAQDDFIR